MEARTNIKILSRCLLVSGLWLLCLFAPPGLRAYQKCHLTFPSVQFRDNTLREVLEMLREGARRITCIDNTGWELNLVLDESRLTPAQLSSRISMDEKDIQCREVLYAVCKALGIGYRMDNYGILISSRAHAGLPPPPTRRAAAVPDPPQRKYLVLLAKKSDRL